MLIRSEKPEGAEDSDYEQATSDFVNVGKSAILLLRATLEAAYLDEDSAQRRAVGDVELAHIESEFRSEAHVCVLVQRDLGIRTMRWTGAARYGGASFTFIPSPQLNLSRPEMTFDANFDRPGNPPAPDIAALWKRLRTVPQGGRGSAFIALGEGIATIVGEKADDAWEVLSHLSWGRYLRQFLTVVVAVAFFAGMFWAGYTRGAADHQAAANEVRTAKQSADSAKRAAAERAKLTVKRKPLPR